jgi:ATP/maltotriose-dependent transcriptional regulator MalT
MTGRHLKLTAAMFTIGVVSFAAGTFAQGRYPEINRAEGHLQAAQGDLRAAADFYGGHKENAERLINQALNQLQEGKGFAASHGH